MKTLSHSEVESILVACLYTPDEIPENPTRETLPEDAIIVEGTLQTFAFHPGRIAAHRQDIKDLLSQLPDSFMKTGGGGMSLINMPFNAKHEQWGEQYSADRLFVLGAAVGMAKFIFPRDMWPALPGSMPYIVIDLSEEG